VSIDPALLPPVTLHLAGDSTVMTYAASSLQEGWGQELAQFLFAKVNIDNQAIGGASVQTFYAGRWRNIMSNLRPGDYVAAAFGANDSGTVAGRHVDPPDFQAMFAKMADEVRAKQATFIAVTPAALQEWSGGVQGNQRLAPYVAVLHDFADASDVMLVDLNARSLELLNQIGQEAAKQIYIGGDKAHFTKHGATQMAQLVAQELERIGSPLGAYVK
jgi:lysophospholipase L1-like esterase